MAPETQSDRFETESKRRTVQAERGFLNRRSYLLLSAAAVGAVGVGTGAAAAESAAAERGDVSFDAVLNAATDLGISDGDRVEGVFDEVGKAGNALIRFPPGEYVIGGPTKLRGDDFGVESTTGNPEDVVFKPVSGGQPTMFLPENGQSGFYVGGVTIDRRADWGSTLTLARGGTADEVYLTDVVVEGWAPYGGERLLHFGVDESAVLSGAVERTAAGDAEFPNTLEVVGTGSPGSYGFTVSGEIAAKGGAAADTVDNVSGGNVEGAIESGRHTYGFSGELTDLSVRGDVKIVRDGRSLSGDPDGRHRVVFGGADDGESGSYAFTASGGVEPDAGHISWAREEDRDSAAETASVSGRVAHGRNAYRFTGRVDALELRGSAVAWFESVE